MLSQAMSLENRRKHPVATFVLDAIWYGWCLLLAYWFFDVAHNWGHQSEFMRAFGIYTGMGFVAAIILGVWVFVTFRGRKN